MQTLSVLRDSGPDRRVLLIGAEAWPMPIPIVRSGERWRFASEEGADEILNRRIGANERNAIYVLRAYIDAQRAYASKDRDGDGVLQYARRLGSTPGKHDGLYWDADAAKGEETQPLRAKMTVFDPGPGWSQAKPSRHRRPGPQPRTKRGTSGRTVVSRRGTSPAIER